MTSGTYQEIWNQVFNIAMVGIISSQVGTPEIVIVEPPVDTTPGQAHRYWRILYITPQSGFIAGLAEVELRASVGGPDVSDGRVYDQSSSLSNSFTAAQAFDDNPATLWATVNNGEANPWISVDFGEDVMDHTIVNEVSLTARNDEFGADQAPSVFEVQYSDDGILFTTEFTVTVATPWLQADTQVFTNPNINPATQITRVSGFMVTVPDPDNVTFSDISSILITRPSATNVTFTDASLSFITKPTSTAVTTSDVTAYMITKPTI